MNPLLHAPRRHSQPPSPAGAGEAWPGDELEADWSQNWPPDLEPGLHAGLVVLVLLGHVLLALAVLGHRAAPSQETQPRLITAQVISEAGPAPVSPRAEPPAHALVPPPAPPTPPRPAPAPAPVLAAPTGPTPSAQTSPAAESRAPAMASPSPPASPANPPPSPSPSPSPSLQAPQAATVPAPIAPARTTPANESARSAAEPKELPSSDVRYLYQPKLVYPRASQEMGETGVVKVRVLVDEEGHPRTVQVVKSSGFPRLDRQAIQTMNATRFQPHMEGGVPRAVWVSTEVTFQLD